MYNKHILITLSICLSVCAAQAQKEGNVWHFGVGAAIDFNSGAPVITTPSAMRTFEGCASIADANGNLLFYTNGGGRDSVLSGQSSGKIWNRNHEVMYDMGNTEGGGFSAAQSSVIIPRPGAAGRYLLFTMEEVEFYTGGNIPSQPQGRGLSWFEIDMSLNGGLGGVATYTPSVLVPSYEGLCVVRHTNGSDYWIIVHNDQSGFAVFSVTAAGVGAPVFYNTPSATGRIIKASPDGKWLCCPLANGTYGLFPFDAGSGTLSTTVQLSTPISSMEFSPNSKRLFLVSVTNEVGYLDLTSANIDASYTVIGQVNDFAVLIGQMQLAPDGAIYFVQSPLGIETIFLSAIVCPNTAPFVEFKKLPFNIVNGQSFLGLPNFDNAIFRRESDPPLIVDLGEDRKLCQNESIVLDAGVNNATYAWSTGAPTQTLQVSAPGTYTVTVTAAGCGIGIDTIKVSEVLVNADAGDDISICAGTNVTLAGEGNGTLLWSPAQSLSGASLPNPVFSGNTTTSLVLSVSKDGCTAKDSVLVTVLPVPQANIITMDTTIIAGQSVQITGSGTGNVLWSPGTGLSCTDCLNPIASPEATTTYTLLLTNSSGCTDTSEITIAVNPPDCKLNVPNAFTPNGDDANDRFQPVGASVTAFNLTVYNRWGDEVFRGNTAWDGLIRQTEAPVDVYIYRVNVEVCGESKMVSGEVSLLR